MRQSIRALGWLVTLSSLILFAFLASALYSIVQIAIMDQGIRMGDLQTEFKNGSLMMSMPITINNTGFYEINEFKMTTTLKDSNGSLIATNTTRITGIKRGEVRSEVHVLSLSLYDLFSRMNYLLFNDTEIKLLISAGFKYAYALEFQVSMTNISMPWKAPFHGLKLKNLSIQGSNGTHLFSELNMNLENHFFTDVGGQLRLTVYNENGEQIGEGKGFLYVPSGGRVEKPIPVLIALDNPEAFTGRGYADVYLQIPMIENPIKLGRVEYE